MTIGAHVYGREVDNKNAMKCTEEYSCASCNEVRICAKARDGWEEQLVFSCNSKSPYCDYATGTCTSEPSLECAPTGSFVCMRDGTFPDPADYKQYHVCSNYTSFDYNCGSGSYYNSHIGKCDNSDRSYMPTFDCSEKSGVKIAYENDANIFAYCVNGVALFVDRCPANFELSSSEQMCLPKCGRNKVMPDVNDCTKYYKCSDNPYSGYRITHLECPPGYGFGTLYYDYCVPLCSLPECNEPTELV